jgi:hypothetical protein
MVQARGRPTRSRLMPEQSVIALPPGFVARALARAGRGAETLFTVGAAAACGVVDAKGPKAERAGVAIGVAGAGAVKRYRESVGAG